MKKLLLIPLLAICIHISAQSSSQAEAALNTIHSKAELEALQRKNPKWQIDTIELNSNNHEIGETIASLAIGEIKTVEEKTGLCTYKLINVETVTEYRASHLYLASNMIPIEEIEALRPRIIREYKNGVPFADLCTKYSSYNKPNDGDLGWFKSNTMVPEFSNAVINHKKGDIFTVDVPHYNWYYVVLKTHDDRMSTIYVLIKVKIRDSQ